MQYKLVYPQLPIIVYRNPKFRLIKFFLSFIRNLLTLLGLLLLGGLVFLYFQGQQVAHSFDEEFISFFGNFVEQIFLKKDVASALLIKTPLEKGVTIEQATDALKKYATQLNITLITSYPLQKKIKAITGKPSHRFVEIFEFCDITVAASLLEHNPDFAAYFPCRIALYEDLNGQVWFATLNMELLLHGTGGIDPQVKAQALKIQESLLKIMGAGAHGVL